MGLNLVEKVERYVVERSLTIFLEKLKKYAVTFTVTAWV